MFDCFGAGQQIVQITFGGQDWRTSPGVAQSMFAVLPVMRQLHELLWHLAEALSLPAAAQLHPKVRQLQQRTEELTQASADELTALDMAGYSRDAGDLLGRVSAAARSAWADRTRGRRGGDYLGANLRGADLRGASLRGAYYIGADLRDADLRNADLLGTDLRGADLRGTDLTGCLFLTQPQLEAATGDSTTRIPQQLDRPAHWG